MCYMQLRYIFKEALHIKFKKPIINRQLCTQGSSFVLNVF